MRRSVYWGRFSSGRRRGVATSSTFQCLKPCAISILMTSHTISRPMTLWGHLAGPACRNPMFSNARMPNGSHCICRRRKSSGWPADAMERPEFLKDHRFSDRAGRIKHNESLISLMAPIFKRRSRADWCAALAEQGVPYSPVYNSAEALEDPQAKHLGIQVEASHSTMGRFRSVRFPVNFDGQRNSEIEAPPVLGEHDEASRAAVPFLARPRNQSGRSGGMRSVPVNEPAEKMGCSMDGTMPPTTSKLFQSTVRLAIISAVTHRSARV